MAWWGGGMGDVYVFSCIQLCDPMDCSPPGSSVHGILQARIVEWVAISFSRHMEYSAIRKEQNNAPVFLPGESQGQGSLVGCCLWIRTESDLTEAT